MKRKTQKKPVQVANLTRIAAVISVKFKIPCSKQAIKNWQKWNPPFPPPKESNRYDQDECFDWIEKHYLPKNARDDAQLKLMKQAQDADARKKIRNDEEAEFDFKVKKGQFIDRDEARVKAITAIRKYHAFVVEELENNFPFECAAILKDIGATGELVSAFLQWVTTRYQAAIDRIEQRCEDESKEVDTIEI